MPDFCTCCGYSVRQLATRLVVMMVKVAAVGKGGGLN